MLAPTVPLLAVFAIGVSAHATWQELWIGNVDAGSSCVRLPQNNNPVTSVTSNDIACNANAHSSSGICPIIAGSEVTVEMHQQPNDRSCANEAIGGAHYGPISIYMAKVDNAASAVGSSADWFKIHHSGLVSNNPDYFANQVLNDNCGHWTIKVPADIAPGDYLLRAETIALHVGFQSAGAQFYISCYQVRVTSNGSARPPTVKLPGAYSASDPGILVDIHQDLSTYVVPGPSPYGYQVPPIAQTAWPQTATWNTANQPATVPTVVPSISGAPPPVDSNTSTTGPGTDPTPTSTSTTTAPGATQTKYGQCGGTGWTGPTTCEPGSTCSAVSAPWYYQCT